MIEVSQREFQIKYYSYSKGKEVIRVLGRGGVVVGTYYPAGADAVQVGGGNAVQVKKNAVQVGKGLYMRNAAYERFKEVLGEVEEDENAVQSQSENAVQEKYECRKCGGVGVGTHRYWDEIEQEDVEDWFCGRCARGSGIKLKYEN
jgi:hypothetical protein